MKKIFGKLFKNIFILFFITLCFQNAANSYETVLIDFPNSGWHRVFYEDRVKEAIVQYVPAGQTKTNYIETVIFHSYKWEYSSNISAQSILKYQLNQTALRYRDIELTYLKDDPMDTIAVWCSKSASQCEILRAAQGYEGIITMHYINNNPQYFQSISPNWINIMRKVRIYYSYYRWDAIMNKSSTVQL